MGHTSYSAHSMQPMTCSKWRFVVWSRLEGRGAEEKNGGSGDSYMVQESLNFAKDGLGHLDGAGPALRLTQLAQGGQVVHGVGEWLIVPVHQAQALQREDAAHSGSPHFPLTGQRVLPPQEVA